jgi:hypothetical protein
MYSSNYGWLQDDNIHHRIIGWTAPIARYAGTLALPQNQRGMMGGGLNAGWSPGQGSLSSYYSGSPRRNDNITIDWSQLADGNYYFGFNDHGGLDDFYHLTVQSNSSAYGTSYFWQDVYGYSELIRSVGYESYPSQGDISFDLRINYNNDLPFPPTKDQDLGKTFIDRKGSSFVEDGNGGYNVNIVIVVALNKALKHGSDFLAKNPGLDSEILAHELGHVFLAEEAMKRMNIPKMLTTAESNGESLREYFEIVLRKARYESFSHSEEYVNMLAPRFMPPGYEFQYIYNKVPIKW